MEPRTVVVTGQCARGWHCALISLLLFASSLTAQDFSSAFDNLRQLGLPDTKGLRYGKVSEAGDGRGGPFAGDDDGISLLSSRYSEFEMLGNAWLVSPGEPGETFTALIKAAQVVEFPRTNASGEEPVRATWKDVSLADEWENLKKLLESEPFQNSVRSDSDAAGMLLLFAAHLDRAGMKKESVHLVERVLTFAQVKDEAIAGAIGRVAQAEYETALQQVFEDGDWAAFASTCTELTKRFGAGWKFSVGIREVARVAGKQANGPPPLPTVEGIELTEEQRQLAFALSEFRNPDILSQLAYSGPWIFSADKFKQILPQLSGGGENADALVKILEGGFSSIPVLLVLLEDESFLPFAFTSRYDTSKGSIDELIAESVDRNSAGQFRRPATRSDIAAKILQPLIPNYDSHDSTLKDFAIAARAWWEENASLSPLETARNYVDSGSDEHANAALLYLAEHGTEEDRPKVEKHLIAQAINSPWNGVEALAAYAQAQGDDAKGFIEKVETSIQEYLEKLKKQEESQYESYKQMYDASLLTLRGMISDESAEDMLHKVVSGEMELETAQQAISLKLQELPYAEQFRTVIHSAAAAEDLEVRNQLLYFLSYLGDMPEEGIPLEGLVDSWKILLADERESENETSISRTAATFLENNHAPSEMQKMRDFIQQAGTPGYDLVVERAKVRVEDPNSADIPAYPSAADVPEDRGKALREAVLAAAGDLEGLRALLEPLPYAELFYLLGEIQPVAGDEEESEETEKPEPDPVRQAIEEAQLDIADVKAEGDAWTDVAGWKGSTFSVETYDQIIATMLKQAEAGTTAVLSIQQATPFGPLEVSVKETTYDELSADEEISSYALQRIQSWVEEPTPFAAASFGKRGYSIFWLRQKEDEEPEPYSRMAMISEQLKSSQDQARISVLRWLQAPYAFRTPVQLEFLSTTSKERENIADPFQ